MFVVIRKFDDMVNALGGQATKSDKSDIDKFKIFVGKYIQEHDELPSNHQAIKQIQNVSAIDEIEAFLRHNLDYCDDCMLKLYRRYAAGEQQPEGCPCGGE